ncbi:proline dehydrogenase family protein [uncultured Planktosalinus sp.]|uniref:proline dehydrogenase family protein n=1 Tax=uncultured Planktosalinus sp. TaxID=1810935 RepID=UPI0030D6FC43
METKNLFENTEVAFSLKTDSELERAYFLFKMISSEPLVKIGTAATKFALNINLPVEGLIRSTVFDHFCGGVNEEDCMPVVEKMHQKGVCSVLDYSVEGKNLEMSFDIATDKVLRLTEFAENKEALPFSVFKPTGFGRFEVYRKVSENEPLTDIETIEWEKIIERFDKVCQKCSETGVSLLIDAEESWIQKSVDDLILEMMRKYNKDKVVIYNTIQCYRWDRLDYLNLVLKIASEEGFKLGFKIVRGAYLEKENNRAEEMGYKSPICPTKKATDDNFDSIMSFMFDHPDVMTVFIGTHNEESCYKAMELMKQKGIEKNDLRVWFGQLFGMSDHISFNLGLEGYNVSKYLPFGPVKDVMPYLIRRAEENTSVAGQTSRELNLIKREKERRKL